MNRQKSRLSDKNEQRATSTLSVLPSTHQLKFLITLFTYLYALIYLYALPLHFLALSFLLPLQRLSSLFSWDSFMWGRSFLPPLQVYSCCASNSSVHIRIHIEIRSVTVTSLEPSRQVFSLGIKEVLFKLHQSPAFR